MKKLLTFILPAFALTAGAPLAADPATESDPAAESEQYKGEGFQEWKLDLEQQRAEDAQALNRYLEQLLDPATEGDPDPAPDQGESVYDALMKQGDEAQARRAAQKHLRAFLQVQQAPGNGIKWGEFVNTCRRDCESEGAIKGPAGRVCRQACEKIIADAKDAGALGKTAEQAKREQEQAEREAWEQEQAQRNPALGENPYWDMLNNPDEAYNEGQDQATGGDPEPILTPSQELLRDLGMANPDHADDEREAWEQEPAQQQAQQPEIGSRDRDIFQLHSEAYANLEKEWADEDKRERTEADEELYRQNSGRIYTYGNSYIEACPPGFVRDSPTAPCMTREAREAMRDVRGALQELDNLKKEQQTRQDQGAREYATRQAEHQARADQGAREYADLRAKKQARRAAWRAKEQAARRGGGQTPDAAALWGVDLKKIERELEQARAREAREQEACARCVPRDGYDKTCLICSLDPSVLYETGRLAK